MAKLKINKVITLPETIEPDTIYLVRTGDGFDLQVSDATGSIVHKLVKPQDLNNILSRLSSLESSTNFNTFVGALNYLDNSEREIETSSEYYLYERSPRLKELFLSGYITISFDIKAKVAGSILVYSSNNSGIYYSGSVNIEQPNVWYRKSITVLAVPHSTTSDNANGTLEFYGTYNTGRTFSIRKVKIEKGRVSTDWSPSINDLLEPFKQEVTRIEDTIKELYKKVNGSDYESVGRNYLKNSASYSNMRSNNSITYPITSGIDETGNWISGTYKGRYYISTYGDLYSNLNVFTEDLTNQQVTTSIEIMANKPCQIRLDYGSSYISIQPNKWTRITNTSLSTRIPTILMDNSNTNPVYDESNPFKLYHRNWKVEKGSKATKWIPATED